MSLRSGRGHNAGWLSHGRSCRDKFGVKEQVDRHAKLAIQIMKHPPTYKRPKRLLFDVIAFLENIRRSFPSFVRQFRDRKSTRLNSSHLGISYAVFCLKKKKKKKKQIDSINKTNKYK